MAKDKKDEETARSAESTAQFLKYAGASDRRVISKADWKSVGLEHEEVVFDRDNGWMISTGDISQEALDLLLARDPEFKVQASERSVAAMAKQPEDLTPTTLSAEGGPGFHADSGGTLGGSTRGGGSTG